MAVVLVGCGASVTVTNDTDLFIDSLVVEAVELGALEPGETIRKADIGDVWDSLGWEARADDEVLGGRGVDAR